MVALEHGECLGIRTGEGGGERHEGLLPGCAGGRGGGDPSTLTCTEPTRNRPARALRPSTPVVRRAALRVGERSNGAANGRHPHSSVSAVRVGVCPRCGSVP
ncbi:hypothetical protein GCM10010425_19380 [Streptomyces spororaveus]|uniref:Uncharacterized protein n=1 Tax=Streptomyces spororaveus TaxID=284039 RepID=A0ABQ3T7I5_9ACTN|nr:hypothetical protein Sspor_19300 [Streptomyces spororaveus]